MKRFLMIGMILFIALAAGGCAPNLVSYPPTAINPVVVEGLQNFKISSQMPSEEYGSVFKSIIEYNRNTILVYQQKLFPVFNQMHQKYQKKDYDGTNILIAKARVYNAEWLNSYKDLKIALKRLDEVNKKTGNSVIKVKTEQAVDLGRGFIDKVFNTQNTIRKLLDIAEGYDKARVEMNLSFLTEENEQKFNSLSQSLYQSGRSLNKEGEVLFQLLVELNELLNKGGGPI